MYYGFAEFFIKIDFYLELSAAALILLMVMQSKRLPDIRFLLCAGMELVLIWNIIPYVERMERMLGDFPVYLFLIAAFLLQLILLFVTIHFTAGVSWSMSCYLTFLSYLVEHTANALSSMASILFYFYQPDYVNNKITLILIYAVILLLEVSLLYRSSRNFKRLELKVNQSLPLLVMLMLFGMVLNLIMKMSYFKLQSETEVFIVSILYDILCCVFIFLMQFITIDRNYLVGRVETEEMLRQQREQQYLAFKTNIDIINEKCHRLKHQIQELKENENNEGMKETLIQLEDGIMMYNAIVQTGNEVIDVAVNEKSLICERDHITLTCMINGKNLESMDAMDVYQLFRDTLDYMIAIAKENEKQDKRIISITQCNQGCFCCLQFECYCKKEASEKEQVEQIEQTINKYHGIIEVTQRGEIRILRMMLRMPEKNSF